MAAPRKTTSTRSRSGNPATRAGAATSTPITPTSPTAWKGGRREIIATVELPSGNVATLRRPGMEAILSKNLLPDPLSNIASKAIEAGRSGKKIEDVSAEVDKEVDAATAKDDGYKQTFEAFDKVAVLCFVEPAVRLNTVQADDTFEGLSVGDVIPLELREDSLLYTDEIDIEDKTFVFNYAVGGSADLATFREQSQ